jgi:hypothetical protein
MMLGFKVTKKKALRQGRAFDYVKYNLLIG